VGVVKEQFGEREGVRVLSLFDEIESREDGNSPVSEQGGRSEFVEF
jgi:hypothetical protein